MRSLLLFAAISLSLFLYYEVRGEPHNANAAAAAAAADGVVVSVDADGTILFYPSNNDNDANNANNDTNDDDMEEVVLSSSYSSSSSSTCGVYFAPSTIPGAGFGLFAGKSFTTGEEVTPGDLVVPVTDMNFHMGAAEDDDYYFLWNEYNWDASSFPRMDEDAAMIGASSFGVGAVPNCHFPLNRLEDSYTDIDQAELRGDRGDPGAGAFTLYHNRRGLAKRDIPVGMELFVDYGESYFETRKKQFGPIPTLGYYDEGNRFLRHYDEFRKAMLNFRERVCKRKGQLCEHWDLTPLYHLIHDFKKIWKAFVFYTLPEDPAMVDELLEKGVEQRDFNRSIVSLEWLQTHGTCMDHLAPKRSTLPQAGRGAFARRPIRKGQVVTSVPLIHVVNRRMFQMYRPEPGIHPDDKTYRRDDSEVVHQQLLLNYCFGSSNFTFLLCPYGVGNGLVNHHQEKANAEIVWSRKGMREPEWLEQDPSEWLYEYTAGLAFDYIAKRDIAEGEEVFIDYGDDFEAAWQRHVADFEKASIQRHKTETIRAYEMDGELDSILKTMSEGAYSRDHIRVMCREEYRQMAGLPEDDVDMHPCRIIDRRDDDTGGGFLYTAELWENEDDAKHDECYEYFAGVLFDVPRDAFYLEDAPGTRDYMQPWSFRHDMRIPDAIVPKAWLGADFDPMGIQGEKSDAAPRVRDSWR